MFPFISISLGIFGCYKFIRYIASSGSLYDTRKAYWHAGKVSFRWWDQK